MEPFVNFLNIEYILLRLSIVFNNIFGPIWGAPPTREGLEGSTSFVSSSAWFWLGQIGLLGLAVAFVLLILAAYVRIRLEIIEHEGFHARDAKYHHLQETHVHVDNIPEVESKVNTRWDTITQLSSSTSESDWRRAIMEADILLGEALENQGYRGTTIGDRLKDANPLQMTTLNLAWKAHKVRNEIAHGGEGYHLSERDTKDAIENYRRVFEEFGAV